jgi:hypothetical protein
MSDSCTCGCCEGIQTSTPAETANRPGLPALRYRAGTHADFLASMLAALSRPESSALLQLRTRVPADPSIALLDAWATVADVLTFYQERIVNEGYLRTATERRSILELGRLVGYALRPGVSATAFLSYTLDDGARVEIPQGARSQTIPGPGELPQPFETAEPLAARAEWNDLEPRLTRPQRITLDQDPWTSAKVIASLWLRGTDTKLEPGDPLLFVFGEKPNQQVLRWVKDVQPDFELKRTRIMLQSASGAVGHPGIGAALIAVVEAALAAGEPLRSSTAPVALEAVGRLEAIRNAVGAGAEPQVLAELAMEVGARLETLASRPAVPRAIKEALPQISAQLGDAVQHPEAAGHGMAAAAVAGGATPVALDVITGVLGALALKPSIPPAGRARLARDPAAVYAAGTDAAPRLIGALRPEVKEVLYRAWASRAKVAPAPVRVYAPRVRASLFGHNAPERLLDVQDGRVIAQRPPRVLVEDPTIGGPLAVGVPTHANLKSLERRDTVDLDGSYDEVVAGSWVVVMTPQTDQLTDGGQILAKAAAVQTTLSRADYGLSGKITRIGLQFLKGTDHWIKVDKSAPADLDPEKDNFKEIRETEVLAQSEELVLAEAPIPTPVCGDEIELGAVYDGLDPGRWLIVTGERADIPGVTGVQDGELVMLAAVAQTLDATLPGDTLHTTLTFATGGLAHCYRRETVSIFGNVVKATHGETRSQVLGGGDGSRAFQRFELQAKPLTYLPAPTASGARSTLAVRVNEVLWQETARLTDAGPADRVYVTSTDDDDKTSVIFGDGIHASRLPSGRENVAAEYRTSIGRPGNVKAGQIALLNTRPLGVKAVVNPLRSSGGADRDSRDQARANLAIALRALGRLVSVQDYADFARAFAGIGKTSAARLTDGARQLVHVTVAGVDDIPIDPTSDLYRNLLQALQQLGDPHQPVRLATRDLELIVISAGIRVAPGYRWEAVEPMLRTALIEQFGFRSRELGQDAFPSEVLAAMQSVTGVEYADLDTFGAVSAADLATLQPTLAGLAGTVRPVTAQLAQLDPSVPGAILPAQLAVLTPDVPDTLLLKELTP